MAKRVLVVEDDLLNRMLFCAWLEGDEFEVEPVADGKEVLDRARTFGPDLIIMDIQLPNVSGVQLIESLRADPKLQEIPVIVDGELEARKVMNLSLSCDHRVVDGWDAASFLQALKGYIENPLRLLSA